jgi:phosphoribosylglycinamide formyltransferase-1
MEALAAAAASTSYPAEITLVLADRPNTPGLRRAAAWGIATGLVDHTIYGTDREAFERALVGELAPRGIELVCLAGFMRVLSPWFVNRWHERLLNVHPALLPAFRGLDTHRRAVAAGVKVHGATVHLVVPEVDCGPIIAQAALGVHEEDTEDTLAARVLALEHRIYPIGLRLVAEGRVRVRDGRCLISGAVAADEVLLVPKL